MDVIAIFLDFLSNICPNPKPIGCYSDGSEKIQTNRNHPSIVVIDVILRPLGLGLTLIQC